MLLCALTIATGSLLSAKASEVSSQNIEVINLVENTEMFAEYLENNLIVSNPKTYYDQISDLWLVHYDTPIQEKEVISNLDSIELSVTSTIPNGAIFVTDGDSLEIVEIDYSNLLTDNEIHFVNYESKEKEIYNVLDSGDATFIEYRDSVITQKKKIEENYKDQVEPNYNSGCMWWVCTATESGGGHVDGGCSYWAGLGCGAIGIKIPLAGLVCQGTVPISCWVSEWRVCVDGYWETRYCPIQSR